MDRQEAVQKLATVGCLSIAHAEDLYDSFFPKPVVPQYVADWYEGNKDDFEVNLFNCVYGVVENYDGNSANEFENWLMSKDIDVLTILVNMHQFGYEVEEVTKYRVRVKAITDGDNFLKRDKDESDWYFGDSSAIGVLQHTRKELEEADFGWVFDCEGVEVKEVG